MLNQRVRVTSINGNQVTFTPALNFSFDQGLSPKAVGYGDFPGCYFVGLEDLTVSGSTGGIGILLEGDYGCWLKNVEVTKWHDWGVEITFSVSCEVRDCYIHEPSAYDWSTGYPFQFDLANNCLTENNVFWHYQAGLILQGCCSGNVFGYNACFEGYDVYLGVGIQLESYYANHTPYPLLNLFEGNYGNAFHEDFYYGPSAKTTLLRNYFTGTDPDIKQNRICINLDSHQWSNSVVGNVLGSVGTNAPLFAALPNKTIAWTNVAPLVWGYDPGTANFSYSSNVIFRLGYPFSGNNSGTAPYSDGSTNHLDGYDLLVRSNTLIHGNWDYAHKSVVWDPGISDMTIPNSYYLSSKPGWFGTLQWPPYDPNNAAAANLTNIPAGYRFVFGTNPPSGPANQAPVAVASAAPMAGAAPLPVAFSSVGSFDPEGVAVTFFWTFGDGTISTVANPTHTYQRAGIYSAQLTISDGVSTTSSRALSINANVAGSNQPPVAVARATPTNGSPPLTVVFSSAGSIDPEGSPLRYDWTFGDGTTSTAANPTHTYQAAGEYVARLMVSDGATATASGLITVRVGSAPGGPTARQF